MMPPCTSCRFMLLALLLSVLTAAKRGWEGGELLGTPGWLSGAGGYLTTRAARVSRALSKAQGRPASQLTDALLPLHEAECLPCLEHLQVGLPPGLGIIFGAADTQLRISVGVQRSHDCPWSRAIHQAANDSRSVPCKWLPGNAPGAFLPVCLRAFEIPTCPRSTSSSPLIARAACLPRQARMPASPAA